MLSHEIRQRFIDFFQKRGHAVIPSAPLVPHNDPSVLFNTAGMQPLVPYLLGQKHPAGTRIVDVQKCVRTGDLEDIGDNRHFSFFEMLGNWSLGDYFKEEAIKWSYEFLTSKEEGLGLDASRLYVTIFEGDENAPFDQESKDIWMHMGIPEHRIYALPAEDNWWSPGDNGPCGPCSEMFYDMTEEGVGDISKNDFIQAVKDERVIEIWNDVFMEYEKKDGKVVGKLAQKNVDTGAGLERITAVMQGKKTAYDTDLFIPIMDAIKKVATSNYDELSARIIADHVRSSVFLITDNVLPSNKDRGYVLRRLLRRALVKIRPLVGSFAHKMVVHNIKNQGNAVVFETEHAGSRSVFYEIVEAIFDVYKNTDYLKMDFSKVLEVIFEEEIKFRKGLDLGFKEIDKGNIDPFDLFTTYGFPIELTEEIARGRGISIDKQKFAEQMAEHQKLSQTASAGMFKGGLANHNEKTIKLHTAHHLLLSALQQVLGKEVKQRGSNITEERLRMDFSFDRKMTDEEKKQVEEIVNKEIQAGLTVVRREMSRDEAEKIGAEMEFGAKYPETVSVYFIEDAQGHAISKEFCGGPHVSNTKEIGVFKIQKEEASSAGVRRIKAVVE